MRRLHPILVLAGVLLGSAGPRAQDWLSHQHDTARTGRTRAAVKPARLALAWSAPGQTGTLIGGDTLYAKRFDGLSTVVSAFALADGQLRWTHPGTDIYFGNLAVGGPFVLLEGFDFGEPTVDTLTVLDRATGQALYKLELPLSFSFSDPAVRRDPATGQVRAWFADSSTVVGVEVGPAAGTILWSQPASLGNSTPTLVGDSVIVMANTGYAFDQATGARNEFFSDPTFSLTNGAPVTWDAQRGDFYVRLDFTQEGLTRVLAFHYGGQDAITHRWTKTTPLDQHGGMVALGPDGSLYLVRSGELAVLRPEDGSTLKSLPFPFRNGCSPAITRRVVWVHSETQTLAHDAKTLALLRVFEGSAGFGLGFESVGAFVPGTAVVNLGSGGGYGIDVYRQGG